MTNTQKDNLKKTVIKALKIEYGFSPSMFEVNDNQYQYNTDFGLRCGNRITEKSIARLFLIP